MISLRKLSKIYADGTHALSDMSLTIREGMLGLLGPNGAGKTTLLQILALAQEPSHGQRTYFGLDDRPDHRPLIRRMLGYLPQSFTPAEHLSGFEYLRLCAEMRQVPLSRKALEARILALLEAVDLIPAAHRRAASYSGGMIRRLGLAQALIHAPRFLVVDEPTAGLDPDERIRFRNLISDLADEAPVLLSTHIVEDIEATCPRLVIIAAGRQIFDGPPSELMRHAMGRLWGWPAEAPPPADAQRVGRRSSGGDRHLDVLCSPRPIAGAERLEPRLEEAYAAYLVSFQQRFVDRVWRSPEGWAPPTKHQSSRDANAGF